MDCPSAIPVKLRVLTLFERVPVADNAELPRTSTSSNGTSSSIPQRLRRHRCPRHGADVAADLTPPV